MPHSVVIMVLSCFFRDISGGERNSTTSVAVWTQYQSVRDGQTDGRTDKI